MQHFSNSLDAANLRQSAGGGQRKISKIEVSSGHTELPYSPNFGIYERYKSLNKLIGTGQQSKRMQMVLVQDFSAMSPEQAGFDYIDGRQERRTEAKKETFSLTVVDQNSSSLSNYA